MQALVSVMAIASALLASGCASGTQQQRGTVMAARLPAHDGQSLTGARVEVRANLSTGVGRDNPDDATAVHMLGGGLAIRVPRGEVVELGATLEVAGVTSARYLGGVDAADAPTRASMAPTFNIRVRLIAQDRFRISLAGDLGLVSLPLLSNGAPHRDIEPVVRLALVPSTRVATAVGDLTLFGGLGVATFQRVPRLVADFNQGATVWTKFGAGIAAGGAVPLRAGHQTGRLSYVGGSGTSWPLVELGYGLEL